MPLDFHLRSNGYEILVGGWIVWFGRPEDVEWLRTVKVGLFVEILLGRVEGLEKLSLVL